MIHDLSTQHQPISDLFPRPDSREEWTERLLTDEQLQFYREQGYVSGIRMLDERQIAVLKEALSDLSNSHNQANPLFYEFHSNESKDPAKILFHALGAWRVSQAFHDLLWNAAFTVPASQLLEGRVRFWHDQLFCKPPRQGGGVAWHQDYSYWTRTEPMEHLSCWIGLDDSTRDNGCLQYIPGSHRWSLLPITGLAGDMDAINGALTAEQRSKFKPVAVELRAGEAAFHHPLMIHGSYENRTDRPRRATVINVFRDGVRSASEAPPLEGVPVIPKGAPMNGRFFPLLFDPCVLEPRQ